MPLHLHLPTPRPAHAKHFRGGARCIPAQPTYFLKYQQDWIRDDSVLKIMEKARRIGISYASAYSDVRRHSLASNQLDTWVSSRDEPTAQQVVKDCRFFAEQILHTAARDLGRQILTDTGKRPTSHHSLRFANGATLHSVASNADVFAGKGGHVKLDEFALRADPAAVYDIAGPTIDWGGRLEIISTHRGIHNYFHKLLLEIKENGNPKGFSHHRVTLTDALDQGLLWKLQSSRLAPSDPRYTMDEASYYDYQRHRARSPEIFAQEYLCQPEDDATSFLPLAQLLTCLYPDHEAWEHNLETLRNKSTTGAEYYTGIDIGRQRDLTSVTTLERVSHLRLIRHRLDLHQLPFSEQERLIYPLIALSRRTCIDNTGLGMQFAERAQQAHGNHKVEKITFSLPVKEDLAYPVRSAIEDRALRLPNDEDLLADLRSLRKETTISGAPRFIAPANESGHADRFWSLALALHAAQQPTSTPTYRSTSPDTRSTKRMSGLVGRRS